MKWLPVNTNLPVNAIVRLPHPWSGNSVGQETFLAVTGENETLTYDTVSNSAIIPPYQQP